MEPAVRRAFTLIETMIAAVLLALLVTSELAIFGSLRQLQRQEAHSAAARNAEEQLLQLQQLPFAELPPQLLRPDPRGWLQLGQGDVDATSLSLVNLQGPLQKIEVLETDPLRGRVRVDKRWAGQPLQVNYAFFASDRNETHRVPASGVVRLENQPVVRISQVWLARGEQLRPYADWRWSAQAGLQLGPAARGRVVVVDYRAQSVANRVSGQFLDQQLRAQVAPSPIKLLTLQESYAGHGALSITTLRMTQP